MTVQPDVGFWVFRRGKTKERPGEAIRQAVFIDFSIN
jgi:hypothetical protein